MSKEQFFVAAQVKDRYPRKHAYDLLTLASRLVEDGTFADLPKAVEAVEEYTFRRRPFLADQIQRRR